MSLGPDVHVWVKRVTSDTGPDPFERTLDDGESSRAARFLREPDRRAYVTAHGLLRLALSWARPAVRPAAWRFVATENGKPELADGGFGIRFSLSHCAAYTAVALSQGAECGVDVEYPRRAVDLETLACRVLAPGELARFRAASGEERRQLFFRCWTLKEAYTKALGIGLGLPFGKLDFGFAEPIELTDATGSGGHGADWAFWHWTHGACSFAVAFRRASGTRQALVLHDADDTDAGPAAGPRAWRARREHTLEVW